MNHKMDLIKQTDSRYEWECPICDRHVVVSQRGIKIINKGNQSVTHTGATKGLSLVQRIRRLM